MLKKWRTANGILAGKVTQKMLRVLKRGGTTVPGRAAMVFDKEILATLAADVETILVTGTNGKTSTCRMIEHAHEKGGREVVANRGGANMLAGITAEFAANAALTGAPKRPVAVIECDEGVMKYVVPLLKPKVILVNNLFGDQLDRYGEITDTLAAIRAGIELSPESILCLNADCSLVSSLAEGVRNPVRFFGLNKSVGSQGKVDVGDARYCIRCGAEYEYDYHTYAHQGGFRCPRCGYARMQPDVEVVDIGEQNMEGTEFTVRAGLEYPVRSNLPAIYNICNAAGAICAYTAAGHPIEEIIEALADVKSSFGRMENFDLNGVHIQMILVKNPAGLNQAVAYVTSTGIDYSVAFCLNDHTGDGRDISWIWDADFETICADPHRKKIYVSGERAEDLQLRLKYAGAREDEIELAPGPTELIAKMRESEYPVFALPNYTTMFPLRAALSSITGKGQYWER